ncbi:MAG: hypothetical protein U0350_29550 [Caldilineaceae bacterium]
MRLKTLGQLALSQGDLTQAQRFLEETVTMCTSINLRPPLYEAQPLLGLVTLYHGDVPAARQLLEESWRLCVQSKNKVFAARACAYRAEFALWEGDVEQAAHWLAQSLDHQMTPDRFAIFQVGRLFLAARLATAQQQYRRAATLFGLAEQAHSRIHYVINGPMRALADEARATVQLVLEPAVFAEAFAAGRQMELAEALPGLLAPSSIGFQE